MKVLPFTVTVPDDKCVFSEQIELPFFYQYLHRHEEWQITWVQKGEGILVAGNNMHSFRPGDIFLIGANLPHLFKSNPEYFAADSNKNIKACSLYFSPSGNLGALFSLPEMKLMNSFLKKNKHGFKIPSPYDKEISARIQEVHKASGMNVVFNLLKFFNSLLAIQEAETEPLCPKSYSTYISDNEGARFSNIINYIMLNYNNQIALEDIAKTAYMTPHAFCRYFKKHTGYTFVSFLNEVRVNDACKNLIDGKKADCISGVAYKSGFSSITNFNRVFKSVMGQSPRAYMDAYYNANKLNSISV